MANPIPVTIGSQEDNSLVIAENHVSRHHAVAFKASDGWHLYDLGSTNGVLVNGQRIAHAVIGVQDKVTLGHHAVVDVGSLSAAEKRPIPVGRTSTFVRIGKASDNDVSVDDVHVSRYHAIVRRDASGAEIFDAGSRNGTLVNGAPIEARAFLGPTDTIGLGQSCQLPAETALAPVQAEPLKAAPVTERSESQTGKTAWIKGQFEKLSQEQAEQMRRVRSEQDESTARLKISIVAAAAVMLIALGGLGWYFLGRSPHKALVSVVEAARQSVVMVVHEPAQTVAVDTTEMVLFSSASDDAIVATGFVYRTDGRPVVLTNKHVVSQWLAAKQAGLEPGLLQIKTQGKTQVYDVTVLAWHPDQDVAVLGFVGQAPDCRGVEMNPSIETIQPGDPVASLSFPLGMQDQSGDKLQADLVTGSITNFLDGQLKYNLESAPGASGGPIFGADGRVIAINQRGSAHRGQLVQGLNFGVPVRHALDAIDQ